MFKQHKSKIKYSTDRCHLWTEPLTELAASSLWSLFDCLADLHSFSGASDQRHRHSRKTRLCLFDFRELILVSDMHKDNRRTTGFAEQGDKRQSLRRAVRRITCDHITIGSRYSCYIYTRYASRVFTTATMVDGSCLFPLCPALTNTCLQLLTSHFTQAQMWWSDLSDFEWLVSLQRMVPKYNLVVNSIFSS